MSEHPFDKLARTFAARQSRRGALRTFGAAVVASVAGAVLPRAAGSRAQVNCPVPPCTVTFSDRGVPQCVCPPAGGSGFSDRNLTGGSGTVGGGTFSDREPSGTSSGVTPFCGGTGQPCCNGTNCTNGGCCDGSGICRGGTDAGACGTGGGVCFACGTGQGCQSGACVSVVCGGVNQSCCNGTICGSGLTCAGGTCQLCGLRNQLCCAGGTCTGDFTCQGGTCQPVMICGAPRSPCNNFTRNCGPGGNTCFCNSTVSGGTFCAARAQCAPCSANADCNAVTGPGSACVPASCCPGGTVCAVVC